MKSAWSKRISWVTRPSFLFNTPKPRRGHATFDNVAESRSSLFIARTLPEARPGDRLRSFFVLGGVCAVSTYTGWTYFPGRANGGICYADDNEYASAGSRNAMVTRNQRSTNVAEAQRSTRLPLDFVNECTAMFKDRFTLAKQDRDEYSKDPSYHQRLVPDAVFYPNDTEDVKRFIQICAKHKVPVVPFGSGTSLEGHTSAEYAGHGGVTISFSRMNSVIEVHPEDMDVVVQPGITYDDLNIQLEQYNLFFPVDPGPGASIGGMIGTSASGTNAVRYGTMKENVLNLTIVTAYGDVIKTGQRARKSSAGYDLKHLFIGSEGTLGIVTEVTLKLHCRPQHSLVAVCPFETIGDASAVVIEAMQEGIQIGRVELLDEMMMKAVNISASLQEKEKPTLFFEFSGSYAEVAEQEQAIRKIVARHRGLGMRSATGEKAADLWSARKNALWHSYALRPDSDMLITDACVPISRLAECIEETKKDIAKSFLLAVFIE